jgi:hypothetical protein
MVRHRLSKYQNNIHYFNPFVISKNTFPPPGLDSLLLPPAGQKREKEGHSHQRTDKTLKFPMHVALFCAGPRAGLAADTVVRVNNGHYLIAHIIAILILSLEGLFDEFKHIPAADLKAPAAAYAFFCIY